MVGIVYISVKCRDMTYAVNELTMSAMLMVRHSRAPKTRLNSYEYDIIPRVPA